jgi:serine protease SohB
MAILIRDNYISSFFMNLFPNTNLQVKDLTLSYLKMYDVINNLHHKINTNTLKNRAFLLEFSGDVSASSSESLAKEVSAIIMSGDPNLDEVIISIESPGGAVNAYGYAASQIERLKIAGFKTTAVVDKIAASGGYMMACVADKIIAGKLSIIGSIGVVAEFPNVNNLLKDLGVDYQQFTAGKYKRTISMLAEISDDGKKKFQEDLERTYDLFKNHVLSFRDVDVAKVATGEHWYGQDAIKLDLIDELGNLEDLLLLKIKEGKRILSIKYRTPATKGRRFISLMFDELYNTLIRKNIMFK